MNDLEVRDTMRRATTPALFVTLRLPNGSPQRVECFVWRGNLEADHAPGAYRQSLAAAVISLSRPDWTRCRFASQDHRRLRPNKRARQSTRPAQELGHAQTLIAALAANLSGGGPRLDFACLQHLLQTSLEHAVSFDHYCSDAWIYRLRKLGHDLLRQRRMVPKCSSVNPARSSPTIGARQAMKKSTIEIRSSRFPPKSGL